MDKQLKKILVKSVIVLSVIHLGYFIYGYFKFDGINKIDIYTEFYRFKFYDDVSISHFFYYQSISVLLSCFVIEESFQKEI